jgi:hypothetical protein
MSRLLETFKSAVSFIKLFLPRHFLLKGQYQVCGHVFVLLIDFNKLTIMWEFAHDNWKYVKGFIN